MAKVTIQAMAKALNLSRNTVALALKNSAQVSDATKRMVWDYAKKAGYISMPQEEVEDTSYKILVLKKEDKASYWDLVLSGIAEEASRVNCIVMVSIVSAEDEKQMQLPLGYDDSIDAILFVHTFSKEYMDKLMHNQKVGVLLDVYNDILQDGYPGDIVKSEGRRSVMCLTERLIQQGLHKIAYVGAINIRCVTALDREMGYLDAMHKYNLPIRKNYVVNSEEMGRNAVRKNMNQVIDSFDEMPEAIVCANDDTARKITQELRARNIRVPEDIAITGFDDEEGRMINSFFTTVHVDAKALGRRMVEQMLWRCRYKNAPYEMITVESKVVIRKSSERNR